MIRSTRLLQLCTHREGRCEFVFALLRRYKESLQAASKSIKESWPENADQALVLNLGPAWMNAESYALFRDNVIEIPFKYWESPPGLGLCPLDVLFTVCSSIASWLTLHEGNFVVRNSTFGSARCGCFR